MSYEVEEGDVLRDPGTGETFTVESIENGLVEFDEEYDHYVDEVEGFVDDGLWEEVDE